MGTLLPSLRVAVMGRSDEGRRTSFSDSRRLASRLDGAAASHRHPAPHVQPRTLRAAPPSGLARLAPHSGECTPPRLVMRVPVGVKASVFALAIMGSYTYFANSIPQIESKPPQELSLEGGNVTPAQLVKAGEEIYKTKGTCEICHRIGQKGTRAPDLAGIGSRAATRKPGMSGKAYIIESLLHPNAYVVEGYPPIMPAVDKPPIALNRSEVWALTAFLESLGGTVDVALNDIPASVGAGGGAGASAAEVNIPGDPKAGQAIFSGKAGCIACHKAGKIGASPVGPDLSQIAKIQTPDYIMKKIIDPKGSGTVANYPPGVMPQDFGTRLTSKEYVDLVAFLLTLK